MTAERTAAGTLPIGQPLTDTSPDGLRRAIEADSIGTRVLNGEIPLEPHLEADAAWARAAIPDPFRNVVASARFMPATADRRIGEIAAAFAERRTSFLWWRADFHTPSDLGQRLDRVGIVEVGSSPAMAMDLDRLPPPEAPPEGLDIRAVTDEPGLRAYLKVLRAEPPPAGAPPIFRPEIARAILVHTTPRLPLEPVPLRYVGWLDGRPVATSRLSLAGGAAGLYAVSTIPEARGRGIGRAMSLVPLRAARSIGYRIGTLQASDAGYRIYCSIGFADLARYAIHVGGLPPGALG